jgi:fatty-acyl-CoA synthase
MAVLWVGGMIYVHRDFDAGRVLASIAAEKLTCGWLAPVMLGSVLAHPDRASFDVSTIRWVIGGGERTPEARIRAFAEYFTKGRYIDGYGLTESCSGDTLMEAGREIEKIGSVGRALPHVEVDIRDPDGKPLPPGQAGEICLRGPRITQGYWRDEKKTAASFYGDWFRTGDVGYLDEEGYVYIVDRKKDMIISGGFNVYCAEVEAAIMSLPEVYECAVIGIPHDHWGEAVKACVVLRPGTSLSETALISQCKQKLGGVKAPKSVEFCDEIPKTAAGKIDRKKIRAPYWEHAGRQVH